MRRAATGMHLARQSTRSRRWADGRSFLGVQQHAPRQAKPSPDSPGRGRRPVSVSLPFRDPQTFAFTHSQPRGPKRTERSLHVRGHTCQKEARAARRVLRPRLPSGVPSEGGLLSRTESELAQACAINPRPCSLALREASQAHLVIRDWPPAVEPSCPSVGDWTREGASAFRSPSKAH